MIKNGDYKERNKHLYQMLKQYQICVIPDPNIDNLDSLPQFSIIETSLKEIKKEMKEGLGINGKKRKKGKTLK